MIPDLGETVSLVTGANRGIGREVCRQLAGRGHTVVLTARSADAAATAAHEAAAEPLRLDVTEPASVAAAARWVGERYGKRGRPGRPSHRRGRGERGLGGDIA
jgi:NAD(P)-dependent dehydrogenase (short-subunit alcohol dehydrogenase family)